MATTLTLSVPIETNEIEEFKNSVSIANDSVKTLQVSFRYENDICKITYEDNPQFRSYVAQNYIRDHVSKFLYLGVRPVSLTHGGFAYILQHYAQIHQVLTLLGLPDNVIHPTFPCFVTDSGVIVTNWDTEQIKEMMYRVDSI